MNFEEFWRSYPRKVGRFKAEQLWNKMTPLEQINAMNGLKLWKQAHQWNTNDGLYIPHGSTFLAQRRYLDEPWIGAFDERRSA